MEGFDSYTTYTLTEEGNIKEALGIYQMLRTYKSPDIDNNFATQEDLDHILNVRCSHENKISYNWNMWAFLQTMSELEHGCKKKIIPVKSGENIGNLVSSMIHSSVIKNWNMILLLFNRMEKPNLISYKESENNC